MINSMAVLSLRIYEFVKTYASIQLDLSYDYHSARHHFSAALLALLEHLRVNSEDDGLSSKSRAKYLYRLTILFSGRGIHLAHIS